MIPRAPKDEADTGLPGFRTWRGVYIFVCVSFIAWVALLSLLSFFFK